MKRISTSKALLIRFVIILAVSVVTSSNLFGQQLQVQLTPQVKQGGYHISCTGQNNGVIQSLVLGGKAPYTYLWSDGSTQLNRTGLSAGTYILTVTDSLLAQVSDTVELFQPQTLSLSAQKSTFQGNFAVSEYGSTDGSIQVLVSGGVPPYNYSWNTGATQSILSSIGSGSYACTITDAAGCTSNISETLNQPSQLSASIILFRNVSCNGDNDGSATVSVTGGLAPYEFRWASGESDSIALSLSGGTQNIDIHDRLGTTVRIPFTIQEPDPIQVDVVIPTYPNGFQVSCNGCFNGSVSLTAFGGTAPYSVMWRDSIDSFNRSQLGGGKYSFTVTDNNGCKTVDFIMLKEPERDDWSRSGNEGVDPSSEFIGTTDFTPIAFKTNNQEVLRIAEDGNIGIGTSSPEYKFDVDGNVRLKQNVTLTQIQTVSLSQSNSNLNDYKTLLINENGDLFKSNELFNAGVIEPIIFGECLERSNGFITTWQSLPPTMTGSKKILFAGSNPDCAPYVGIGTNSPLIDFHVVGSIYTSNRLQIGGSFDENNTNGLLVNGRGLINESLLIKNSFGLLDALVIETGSSKFKNTGNHTLIIEHVSNGEYNVANTISVDNSSTRALLIEGPSNEGQGNPVRPQFVINGDGSTIIGNDLNNDDLTSSKLKVYGLLSARKIIVTQSNFADYVFDDNYQLLSLSDLKMYIEKNKSLPGMPSQAEISKQGYVDLFDIQLRNIEKTEELYLYILQLKEQINTLQDQLDALSLIEKSRQN